MSQFHESPQELDKIRRRREIRFRLQKEYNRINYNPFRLIDHIEIMDPAVSRYSAMRAAMFEHWRPSWGHFLKYTSIAYVPIVVMATIQYYKMKEVDRQCRSGELPYEKRCLAVA